MIYKEGIGYLPYQRKTAALVPYQVALVILPGDAGGDDEGCLHLDRLPTPAFGRVKIQPVKALQAAKDASE